MYCFQSCCCSGQSLQIWDGLLVPPSRMKYEEPCFRCSAWLLMALWPLVALTTTSWGNSYPESTADIWSCRSTMQLARNMPALSQ